MMLLLSDGSGDNDDKLDHSYHRNVLKAVS